MIIFTFETVLIGGAISRLFTAAEIEFMFTILYSINLLIPFLFPNIFIKEIVVSVICAVLTVA